jgi:hypothetical protein
MKSANPEDLLKLKLAERPLEPYEIAELFTPDNYKISALLLAKQHKQTVDMLQGLQNTLDEVNKQQKETQKLLVELSADKKISETKLARFFTTAPHLLVNFDYDFDEKSITFKELPLEADSEEIAFLSLSLEEYFGTNHIPFSVLLSGIKRYFAIKKKQNFAIRDFLEDYCEETLANTKTKKRTRIYFKNLKAACEDCPEVTPKVIKDVMQDLGFEQKTDASRVVFFERAK